MATAAVQFDETLREEALRVARGETTPEQARQRLRDVSRTEEGIPAYFGVLLDGRYDDPIPKDRVPQDPHEIPWSVPVRPDGAWKQASDDEIARFLRAPGRKGSEARSEAFHRVWPELSAYARELAPEMCQRCENPAAEDCTPFVVWAVSTAASRCRALRWRSFVKYARKVLRSTLVDEMRGAPNWQNGELPADAEAPPEMSDPAEMNWDAEDDTPWAGLDKGEIVALVREYLDAQAAVEGDYIALVAHSFAELVLNGSSARSLDVVCDRLGVSGEDMVSALNHLHGMTLDVIDVLRSQHPHLALEDLIYEEISKALDRVR
jgi:hypothetical protein